MQTLDILEKKKDVCFGLLEVICGILLPHKAQKLKLNKVKYYHLCNWKTETLQCISN